MSDFKLLVELMKEWLHQYFEKYPDKKKVIISGENDNYVVEAMTRGICETMCNIIGMFYINDKHGFKLDQWDLVEKRILRGMNDRPSFVTNFIDEVKEESNKKDIPFFGEFSEGIYHS